MPAMLTKHKTHFLACSVVFGLQICQASGNFCKLVLFLLFLLFRPGFNICYLYLLASTMQILAHGINKTGCSSTGERTHKIEELDM